jgi:hypothetical protein
VLIRAAKEWYNADAVAVAKGKGGHFSPSVD